MGAWHCCLLSIWSRRVCVSVLLLHTWLSGEALQVQFHLCIAAVLLCTAQRETCRRWICTGPTVELPLAQLHVHTVNLLVLTRYCDPLVPRLASWWQVTKLKLKQKQKEGIAEARSGRRSPVSSSAYVPCSATYLTPRGKYSGRRTIAICSITCNVLWQQCHISPLNDLCT